MWDEEQLAASTEPRKVVSRLGLGAYYFTPNATICTEAICLKVN
jgi:hypothetical protein